MQVIKLSRGKFAKVDDADYERIVAFGKWYAVLIQSHWYAAAKTSKRTYYMHNVIMGSKPIDHKDGDGLNNQRNNLRKTNHSLNARNSKLSRRNKSGVKGVDLHHSGKFRAQITYNGKQRYLGIFQTLEEAARVATEARREHFGEFFREL